MARNLLTVFSLILLASSVPTCKNEFGAKNHTKAPKVALYWKKAFKNNHLATPKNKFQKVCTKMVNQAIKVPRECLKL